MFKKVVWATDGSESADRALPHIRSMATEGTEVVVLHVDEFVAAPKSGFELHADEEDIQSKIKAQVADLKESGANATLRVVDTRASGAAHAIAEEAAAVGADLVVTGTRGHTPLQGLVLGSVTQRILHIAPCPVLVVPESTSKADRTTESSEAVA
ncbi:MAG TPA: universal stress protein [Thermoleophilaceae bacterium]